MSGSVRVCYASGSWQMIAMYASLLAHQLRAGSADAVETVVAFASTGDSPHLRRRMEQLAALFGLDGRMVWIRDLTHDLRDLDDTEFRSRQRQLRERIGQENVVELWLAYPWAGADRFLLACFPDAHLVLFEDGLFTYSRPWSDTHARRERLRATVRYWKARIMRDPRALVSVFCSEVRLLGAPRRSPIASYLILADVLGVPDAHRDVARIVEPSLIRKVVRKIPAEALLPPAQDRPRALVLGSNFAAWNLIPYEDELAIYLDVVRRLSDAGYEVWWKDHPRLDEPFYPALVRRLEGVDLHALQTDHTLPLEVTLQHESVDLLVGSLTAGLFLWPLLAEREVQVATYAGSFRPHLKWPWIHVGELVEEKVPSLEQVLRCARGPDSSAFESSQAERTDLSEGFPRV
jgi:hypothetical protein